MDDRTVEDMNQAQRERLEAKFFQLAAASGRPRGLEWTGCDFDDDVVYARDRRSGELCALVAVTIRFEAQEGGGMEDVEAVSDRILERFCGRRRPASGLIADVNH